MKRERTINQKFEKLTPIQKVSEETGVSVRIITRAIKSKLKHRKLVAHKLGRDWMVSKSDWEDYIYRRSNMQ